jgi:hypothetical protein
MKPQLSPAERLIYQGRLDEALSAKHLLLTGKALEQFVDQNGEQVRYTKMTLDGLLTYIKELEDILNPCVAAYNRPRPIGFLF